MMHLNIAIDGPAGAGKSTVAKRIAKALNIHYLDTGAMYRALGLFVLRQNADPLDCKAVNEILKSADIRAKYMDDGAQRVFIGTEDVTDLIRTQEISMAASRVSAYPAVRDTLSTLQRKVGEEYDVVMDGRDITTNVLPNTNHKFYVTASPEVRAERRCLELKEKDQPADYETVLADIKKRDDQDIHRDYMPLRIAEDALVVDTSNLDIDAVTALMLKEIRKKEV